MVSSRTTISRNIHEHGMTSSLYILDSPFPPSKSPPVTALSS